MLNTNKSHAWLFMGLLVLFTIIGLLVGSPRSISFDSFGDFLRAFVSDGKTRAILGLIFVDVVTGVACAMYIGTFDIQKAAKFYASNILPYVFGFMLVWTGVYFGFTLPEQIKDTMASASFGMIMSTLTGSIADNIKKSRMGSATPVDVAMLATVPEDARG